MTKKTGKEIKGIISALLVPFDSEGKVNEAGLRQVVRHNIDNMKVNGLYVGGSTGENFLLDTAIKKQIFEIVKDEVKDQVKLIAQVGGPNVYEAIELGKYATDLDYDAISAVTPFYYKFSFDEVKQYYKDITEAVDNDLIIYSIPVLTGINMGMAEFKELFELKNIIGVKFTAADFFLLERLRKAFPDVLIYSGFDEMLYPAAIYHVDGAIGSTYNVNGLRARGILEAVKVGDHEKALKLQNESNDLIEAVLANGLYPTLKRILQLQGADKGEFLSRKPMASMTAEQKEEAERIFKNYL
ncbi:N-acetylneuraminate lyase [Facklamia sp. 7083-14-GEN3]|uniref:N-acetylneuraminate lyase n=1 Tax=Facklamia sp. 7083-14-GEN3 TaxID=2973478 RepID=UPI00215BC527|nr:N-acetylneuraminate lyase [Facklamia sp. 7083-14-GEN3]MCR8968805.1 N-acetylneuraminate lyase [Facklamia sp. 7083-14-GEN3]